MFSHTRLCMIKLLLLAFIISGCTHGMEEVRRSGLYMGTVVDVIARGRDREGLEQAVSAAFSEVERVERLMSAYDRGSDVSRINRNAGGAAVEVDEEVFRLIERSLSVSKQSEGAFDITAGTFKGLWDFDADEPVVPGREEIKKRLGKAGYEGVELGGGHKVRLARRGMRIELGGIAKGYAVDRAVEALQSRGVRHALVNAGGDVRALGGKGGGPWRVGIQHPREDGIIAGIELSGGAVATSGDYQKFFELDGRRFCHIIDPGTGMPAGSVQSATVLASEAWLADALATAVFVLGPDRGMSLVEGMEGVECVIIDKGGRRSSSSGLQDRLTWL